MALGRETGTFSFFERRHAEQQTQRVGELFLSWAGEQGSSEKAGLLWLWLQRYNKAGIREAGKPTGLGCGLRSLKGSSDMSTATAARITTEELLALPENGMDRELIRGELKERPITYRNRLHVQAVAKITHLLFQWLEDQHAGEGTIGSGEVGCILRRDPDTTVGIDVAYFAADVMARQADDTTLVEGAPKLAVEVLSPSDKTEEVRDKVLEYLAAGVELVWIIDPYFHTVTVHRLGGRPEMFNDEETLTGGATLPGLEIRVADIFR